MWRLITRSRKNKGAFMKTILTLACSLATLLSLPAHADKRVEAGKAAVTKFNCAQCHGADFKSPIDPAYPNLAGQHRDYLQHALIAYKRGGEGTNGRAHAIMVPEARKLSNQDIENIAAYLASLPGTLVLKK